MVETTGCQMFGQPASLQKSPVNAPSLVEGSGWPLGSASSMAVTRIPPEILGFYIFKIPKTDHASLVLSLS